MEKMENAVVINRMPSEVLTADETAKLKRCSAVLAREKTAYINQGEALATLKTLPKYAFKIGGVQVPLNKFCSVKFGLSTGRISQIAGAYEAVSVLGDDGKNLACDTAYNIYRCGGDYKATFDLIRDKYGVVDTTTTRKFLKEQKAATTPDENDVEKNVSKLVTQISAVGSLEDIDGELLGKLAVAVTKLAEKIQAVQDRRAEIIDNVA